MASGLGLSTEAGVRGDLQEHPCQEGCTPEAWREGVYSAQELLATSITLGGPHESSNFHELPRFYKQLSFL